MKKIVAITSCPVGVAHTYMAAENLEKAAKELGVEIKVETHGSIGIENRLSAQDISQADGVIIAADTDMEKGRFSGKRLVVTGVQAGIKKAPELIKDITSQKAPIYEGKDTTEKQETEDTEEKDSVGKRAYKSLMNGVSYMVPFVVTGGLMIAIALSLGGQATSKGIVIPEGTIWATINTIGGIAMNLMIPVLSAYIAAGIADRPGLVPGFVGGMLAANGSLYGSTANAGFLGGIITGFLAGYVALAIKKIPVPKAMQSIMPIIVIPILASAVVGFLFIYVLGTPIATLFGALTRFLASMKGGSEVVLALILGAMIAFDMGGPFNKVAFLFGSGLIAEGNFAIMGPIAVAVCIPPLGLGLATFLFKDRFVATEREAGKASFLMGLFGITEGAIPFATADPLRVIPSIMAGSMTGSVIAMLAGVTDHVAHGGPIVAVLGAVDHVLMFFVAVVIGVAVVVALMWILKRKVDATHPAAAVAGTGTTTAATESESATSTTTSETSNDTDEQVETDQSIGSLIGDQSILLDQGIEDKDQMIRSLAQALNKAGQVSDARAFEKAVHDREAESTTGIGMGIAIPHGKSEVVKTPSLAFAREKAGVDWDSLDGKPSQLIFMIAVPEASKGDAHLKILQRLSRKLMDDDFRKELLEAKDRQAIKQLLDRM